MNYTDPLYTAAMSEHQRAWFYAEYEQARRDEVVGVLLPSSSATSGSIIFTFAAMVWGFSIFFSAGQAFLQSSDSSKPSSCLDACVPITRCRPPLSPIRFAPATPPDIRRLLSPDSPVHPAGLRSPLEQASVPAAALRRHSLLPDACKPRWFSFANRTRLKLD